MNLPLISLPSHFLKISKTSNLSLEGKEEVSTSDSPTVVSPADLSLFDDSDDESDVSPSKQTITADNNDNDSAETSSHTVNSSV